MNNKDVELDYTYTLEDILTINLKWQERTVNVCCTGCLQYTGYVNQKKISGQSHIAQVMLFWINLP